MSDAEGLNPDFVNLTANIVSAYVANNSVHRGELSNLIASVHSALQGLGAPPPATEQPKPEPAVSIRRSVTPDYLISLEDGRQYKSLKRHLATRGMTPDEYRAKWGLPKDYPMVAANYAAKRSELARSIGLGQSRRKASAADGGQAPMRLVPSRRVRRPAKHPSRRSAPARLRRPSRVSSPVQAQAALVAGGRAKPALLA